MTVVAEGVEWLRIYYVAGVQKLLADRAINDPPCNGYQHALVLTGEKRSTIFCPYTLQAWTVPSNCQELRLSDEPKEWRPDYVVGLITRMWAKSQQLGVPADLDSAALVLRRLGAEVPTEVIARDGTADSRERGGKEAKEAITKPVKREGKRGKFLQWFLDGDGTRSVRETMAELAMTRNNVLSYLFILQKDHGIGYRLVGDAAHLILPSGALFDDEAFLN